MNILMRKSNKMSVSCVLFGQAVIEDAAVQIGSLYVLITRPYDTEESRMKIQMHIFYLP